MITGVAGKPSAEEGVSLEASDNIYNDKQNKVELPNLYFCLVSFLGSQAHCILRVMAIKNNSVILEWSPREFTCVFLVAPNG